MRIAITGGIGFVGSHLARRLLAEGHEVALITRAVRRDDERPRGLSKVTVFPCGLSNPNDLAKAFDGCTAVAHCAGINREIGDQTFQRVHIDGTRNVIEAARSARVEKLLLVSFLRARSNCGSKYHESKWEAEELVRSSGLDYTILKAAMIYGKGDHMLDHISHALHTFPVFALVGMQERPIRPVAIEDMVKIMEESLIYGKLSSQTVPVVGPEELTTKQAVLRISHILGKHRLMIPMPVAFHRVLAWVLERTMKVPLVSSAQIRILVEGVTEPAPPCSELPRELAPTLTFSIEQISKGLPEPGPFGLKDLRCCG